jgi:WD40 repeat protein
LVLDAGTRQVVYRLAVDTNPRAASFSRDGQRLAAADRNGNLKVWEMSTGGEIASTIIPETRQLIFSDDSRRIFIRTDARILLWDAVGNQTVWSLVTHSKGIADSYDGRRLLSYDEDALTVWNAETGKEVRDYLLAGHEALSDPFYSADGREIITVTNLGNIMVWDALRRTLIRTFNVGRASFDFAIAADGRTMAVNRGDAVQIWDYRQGKPSRTYAMPDDGLREIAIAPDGGTFAASSGKNIFLLDAASGKILMRQESAGGVAFSPDGRLLAFSSVEGAKIILWDISKEAVWATLDYGWKYGTSNFDFSPDGLHLGTAGYGPGVMWWSTADSKRRANPEIDRWYPSLDIAFSPDGKTGAIGSYDILIWELASLRRLRVLTGHACYPTRLMYSPDGAALASGSADGTVLLWDMAAVLGEN